MAIGERVSIDIVARDAATPSIRGVRDQMDELGDTAVRTGRRASEAMDDVDRHARSAGHGIDRATNDAGRGFDGVLGKARGLGTYLSTGLVIAAGAAAAGMGMVLKDSVMGASDLAEAQNKLTTVFGDGTATVEAFAKGGAKALGQSELAVKNAAAMFGVYGQSAGLAGEDNAKFATEFTQLSTDLASFYNSDPAEVVEALGSAFRGEAEPMRKFGVMLDDATMREKALELGLVSSTKEALSPQNKVLAARALIMEKTTVAQGDFAKTQGGLANQLRILSASWEDQKAKIGELFLPAITGAVTTLNEKLFPALQTGMEKAKAAWQLLKTGDFVGGTALGEEDSPLVRALFWARDTFTSTKDLLIGAWILLRTGNYPGADVMGVEEDSPIVSFLITLRDWGIDTWGRLEGLWAKLKQAGEGLWPSLVSIGTSLLTASQNLGVSVWDLFWTALDALAGLLNTVLVPAFEWLAGFLKDNPGLVYVLVGAYTAWKLATMGVAAWTAISTAANWLYTTATAAAATTTGAFSTAMAVLSAVTKTHPFVIIAVAVAAFVAAIIWAYNNVEWFRDLVDGAWEIIQTAAKWAWENVLKPVFEAISTAVQKVGQFFNWLWLEVIQPVWNNAILPAIQWAWDKFFGPIFGFIWETITRVGNVFSWLWNEIIGPIWNNLILPALQMAWDNILKPMWDAFKTGIEAVGNAMQWLYDNIILPVWEGLIKPAIEVVWNEVIKPAWEGIKGFVEGVGAFFGGIWDAVDKAVGWVTTAITNIKNAIVGFFDEVDKKAEEAGASTQEGGAAEESGLTLPGATGNPAAGAGNPIPVGGSAEGGFLGGGPGGPRGDRLLRWVSPGEFVVAASATARHRGELEAINADRMADGGAVVGGNAGRAVTIPTFGGVAQWDKAVQGGWTATSDAIESEAARVLGVARFKAEQALMMKNAVLAAASGILGGVFSVLDVAASADVAAYAGKTRLMNTVDPVVSHGAMNMARGTAAMVGPVPPGDAVARWGPLYMHAMHMLGMYTPRGHGRMMYQMQRESSGNPLSYNDTDSNFTSGKPSKGLLQTIPSTFKDFAAAGYNTNIWDPLSNALASLNYVKATYGGPENYPGGAYDNGGMWPSGTVGWNTSRRREAVLTGDETDAYQAHARDLAHGMGGRQVTVAAGAVQINVAGNLDNPAQVRAELERALRDILAEDAGRRL